MSRLKELIDELCPDGVEYKALGECLSSVKNSMVDGPFGSNLKKEHYTDRHEVRVVQLSNIGEGGWVNDNERYTTFEHLETISRHEAFSGDIIIAKMFPAGRAIILPDLGVKYVLSSDAIRFVPSEALDKRYAYYAINSDAFRKQVARDTQGATRPRTGIPKLKMNRIPVPPIEVQREIVRILDSFQELDDALTAEIEAREKQLETYRDELLGERLKKICPDGVEYKALSDLFDIRNGYTPSKKNPAFWEGGTHPWFVMEDIRRDGTVLNESAAHITDEAHKRNGLFPANSIIVATSATIGVHALITVDFLCNQRFACMTIKKKYADTLDIRYVHQAFFALDRWCLEHVDQGNFATVNSAALKAYRIPVPHIEVQREIVRILDSFQEHIEAMRSERDARRKQFEYYRDRLLTFPEKVA